MLKAVVNSSTLLLWLPGAGMAEAIVSFDDLMSCSAEYHARADYMRTLGHANASHIEFMIDRSDTLLHLAEERGPLQQTDCGDGSRGLVFCLGPPSFEVDRERRKLDRLAEFADANRGADRLPVCMEDAACSKCMALLDDVQR
jgi:hypothetical protein